MWINAQGGLYTGDCVAGDRAATKDEVAAWNASREPTYADKRRAEYPPMSDQLDALWKGGTAAEAMRATIMAVKAEFPKPADVVGGK